MNGVMHQPEADRRLSFDWGRAPRYPTGDNPASGDLKNTAGFYCFATAQSELLPLPVEQPTPLLV